MTEQIRKQIERARAQSKAKQETDQTVKFSQVFRAGRRDPVTGRYLVQFEDGSFAYGPKLTNAQLSEGTPVKSVSGGLGDWALDSKPARQDGDEDLFFVQGNCRGYLNGQIFDCDEKPKEPIEKYFAPYLYTRSYPAKYELWFKPATGAAILLDTVNKVTSGGAAFSQTFTRLGSATLTKTDGPLTWSFSVSIDVATHSSDGGYWALTLDTDYEVIAAEIDVTSSGSNYTFGYGFVWGDSGGWGNSGIPQSPGTSFSDSVTAPLASGWRYLNQINNPPSFDSYKNELYFSISATNTDPSRNGTVTMTGSITLDPLPVDTTLDVIGDFVDDTGSPITTDSFSAGVLTTTGSGSVTITPPSAGSGQQFRSNGATHRYWVHVTTYATWRIDELTATATAGISTLDFIDDVFNGNITVNLAVEAGHIDYTGGTIAGGDLSVTAIANANTSGPNTDTNSSTLTDADLTPNNRFLPGDYTVVAVVSYGGSGFLSEDVADMVADASWEAGITIVPMAGGTASQPQPVRFSLSSRKNGTDIQCFASQLRWTIEDGTDPSDLRRLDYWKITNDTVTENQWDDRIQGSFGDPPTFVTADPDDWRGSVIWFDDAGSVPSSGDSCTDAYRFDTEANIQEFKPGQFTLLTCDLQQGTPDLEVRLETEDVTGKLIEVAPLTSGGSCTVGTAKAKKIKIEQSGVDMTVRAIAPLRTK